MSTASIRKIHFCLSGAFLRAVRWRWITINPLDITTTGAATVMGAGGSAEYDAVVIAADANTSHLAAQVGIYTPPLLAHHARFMFRVDGDGWQSRIDKPSVLGYVRSRLTVVPTIVDTVYCTTVPNLGDGVEFRRNGPILAIYGDNLMKFAPVLGEALTDAAINGTTPTVSDLVAA